MSTQVSRPMFPPYLSPLAPWCDSVIVDDSCLSTVGSDASECSVGENTIRRETGDAYMSESSNVPKLDCGSSGDQSVTWSDFVICMHDDGSIEHEKMS